MDDGYSLIDAGDERRLERFGDRLVDRPQPGAAGPQRNREAWAGADLRFERWGGWHGHPPALNPWVVTVAGLSLELRPTPAGQVGLFPEQLTNLGWLAAQVDRAQVDRAQVDRAQVDRARAAALAVPAADAADAAGGDAREPAARPEVLNLFAYTGLATLALARSGAAVVHVDASRPSVAWARRNAELSGLADRPVRWIVDEAETFVAREWRRGRRYDGVVLDPPSYGHGAGGRSWQLAEHLPELLAACAALLRDSRGFCLLTAHTPGHGPERLAALMAAAFRRRPGAVTAGELEIHAVSGARLGLGAYARLAP